MSSNTPRVVCLQESALTRHRQPRDQHERYRAHPNLPTNCGSPGWPMRPDANDASMLRVVAIIACLALPPDLPGCGHLGGPL